MEFYGLERLVGRSPVPHLTMRADVLIPIADEESDEVAAAEEEWFDTAEGRLAA
jgi:hypothetical protein